MHIVQYTASGEAHGLINTLTNSCEDNDFKHMKPDVKEKMKKERKEDNRIENYEYLNRIGNHERLTKPYCRYAGDPIQIWHLIPGKVYPLPVGFAKEVNEMKGIVRSELLEVDGNRVTKDGSPLSRDQEAPWTHRLVRAA